MEQLKIALPLYLHLQTGATYGRTVRDHYEKETGCTVRREAIGITVPLYADGLYLDTPTT